MSAFSDKIAEVNAAADAAIGRVTADAKTLQQHVEELQAKVDTETPTEADLAALAALKAKLDALDPTNPATVAPAPAPTTEPAA